MARAHVQKGKYSEFANHDDLQQQLTHEGYSVFSWQDAPGRRYEPHSHPHDEYIVAYAGCITFRISNQDYPLQAGDALVLPAHTTHEAVNDGSAMARYFICTK